MNQHTIDEMLDLVDENDNVIGQKTRSAIYAEKLSNFRVINAFVVNSRGQIWIPRRSSHKRIFPLCLDMSVGGHVESGESYEQAFKRETAEELNLDISKTGYRLLGKLTPEKHGVSAFMEVYEIKLDAVPDFNKDDFTEFFWLTAEEFFAKIKNDQTKGDLPILIQNFYLKNAPPRLDEQAIQGKDG
jgi:isopentenyldiphosphate isomerase